MPKIHEKTITRLDIDEVANLLDEVESGESLTEKQQKFHEKTKTRDLAMMTLLLGTGIRVSECVGLDMDDVDFKNNGIKIHSTFTNNISICSVNATFCIRYSYAVFIKYICFCF